MSFALQVQEHVARNPVARAIERQRLKRHVSETVAEMRCLETWAHVPSLIQGVTEAIAMSIKTIEGWDDEDGIGDDLVDAIMRCQEMAEAGFVWQSKHCEPLCLALDYAAQILSGQDARAKVKAWHWAQQVWIDAQGAIA